MTDWFRTLKDSGQNNSYNEKNTFISLLSQAIQENNKGNEYSPDITNDKGLTTFNVTAGVPDPEEEAFIRRMQKKKKKGRKR